MKEIVKESEAPVNPVSVFRVVDRTILDDGVKQCETRSECFASEIYSDWHKSPEKLANMMWDFQPFSKFLRGLYWQAREDLVNQIESASASDLSDANQIEEMKLELEKMPYEPEEGVRDWLLRCSEDYFSGVIVKEFKSWLSEKPDGYEVEYIPDYMTADGEAFRYFREEDPDAAELLGIEIVEGAFPGNDHCAAELTISVDEANEIAEREGLQIRFVESDSW